MQPGVQSGFRGLFLNWTSDEYLWAKPIKGNVEKESNKTVFANCWCQHCWSNSKRRGLHVVSPAGACIGSPKFNFWQQPKIDLMIVLVSVRLVTFWYKGIGLLENLFSWKLAIGWSFLHSMLGKSAGVGYCKKQWVDLPRRFCRALSKVFLMEELYKSESISTIQQKRQGDCRYIGIDICTICIYRSRDIDVVCAPISCSR